MSGQDTSVTSQRSVTPQTKVQVLNVTDTVSKDYESDTDSDDIPTIGSGQCLTFSIQAVGFLKYQFFILSSSFFKILVFILSNRFFKILQVFLSSNRFFKILQVFLSSNRFFKILQFLILRSSFFIQYDGWYVSSPVVLAPPCFDRTRQLSNWHHVEQCPNQSVSRVQSFLPLLGMRL